MSPGVFPLQASFVKQAPDIFTQVTALCVGKDDARVWRESIRTHLGLAAKIATIIDIPTEVKIHGPDKLQLSYIFWVFQDMKG